MSTLSQLQLAVDANIKCSWAESEVEYVWFNEKNIFIFIFFKMKVNVIAIDRKNNQRKFIQFSEILTICSFFFL